MVVGDPNVANPNINRWFNTAAFTPTPAFTYGNAPRNLPRTRTDGKFNWDCSVLKSISVRERMRLQIRGEFFSFTNTPVFGAPGSTLLAGDFGELVSLAFRQADGNNGSATTTRMGPLRSLRLLGIVDVAAHVLLSPEGAHEGKTYTLTTPESFTA